MQQNPEVTLDLSLSNRTVDLIDEGYDAVFRTGELPDSGLQARRLAPYRMVLCAAPAYLKWEFDGPQRREPVSISGRFSTDNSEALRAAAVAGQGIILHPYELLAEDIAAGRLVRLLPDYEPVARAMHVLYAPDRRMTPKLRSFLDFAVLKFGPG